MRGLHNGTRSKVRLVLVAIMSLLVPVAHGAGRAEAEHTPPPSTDPNPCDDFVVAGPDGRPTSDRHQTVVQVLPGQICELEQRIIAEIAADRGVPLTLGVRDEILSYGRGEVRARLFDELLRIVDAGPTNRDAVEQDAFEWFFQRYRDLRIEMAENAIDQYDSWKTDPCAFTPPAGYTYDVDPTQCTGLLTVFSGGPASPSAAEFALYGVAEATERMSDGLDVQALIEELAVDYTAYAVGAAAGVAAGIVAFAILTLMTAALLPYVFYSAATLGSFLAIGGMLGPAVVVALAVAVAVVRTIQVVKAVKIPTELQDNLTLAQNLTQDGLLPTDGATVSLLMLTFLEATSPDHPEPTPTAIPAATPRSDAPLFETTIGQFSPSTVGPTFDYLDPHGVHNRAWIQDGWWVIDPIQPDGDIRLDPNLAFWDHDGMSNVARIDGDRLMVVKYGPHPVNGCPSPNCSFTNVLEYRTPSSTNPEGVSIYLGRSPVIDAGPTVVGSLVDGSTAMLGVDASSPTGDALTYDWTITRTLASGGGSVSSTATGNPATHTWAGGGSYDVEVTVTSSVGAAATATTNVVVDAVPSNLSGRTLVDGADAPWSEGSSTGTYEVSTTPAAPDAVVTVDWDGDGNVDDTATANSSGVATFSTHPAFPEGSASATFTATDAGTATVIGEADLAFDVVNAPPSLVDVEIFDPLTSSFRRASRTTPVAFSEGDVVRARFRVTDPGNDPIDATVLWLGVLPTGLFSSIDVLRGVPSGEWIEVSYRYLDHVVERLLFSADLFVLAVDDAGAADTSNALAGEPNRGYVTVSNVPPTIDSVFIDNDDQGNVTLDALLGDAVLVPVDIESMTIDWGDGSGVDDARIDRVRNNQLVTDNVVGHGTHRYAAPGTYTATITVDDDGDTSAVEIVEIVVTPFAPVIADVTRLEIGVEDTPTTIGVLVTDGDTDVRDVTVTVDWGDGTVGAAVYDPVTGEHTATHVYPDPGSYDVEIVANDGVLDSALQPGKVLVADAAPTVSVEQAAGQSDPTSKPTITFDVVFSEPVSGFDGSDVALTGTAGANSASVVDSGDATTFTVEVTGMTTTGTVIAAIPIDAASDTAGNGNEPSTSTDATVTWEQPIELILPGTDGFVTVPNDSGAAGAVVTYEVGSIGGVGDVTVTCGPPSGSFFPLGSTEVVCAALDASESSAATALLLGRVDALASVESFTVVVTDVEKPTIASPADVTRHSPDGQAVTIDYPLPLASDNSGAVAVTCSPGTGSAFALGRTTVTCVATDTSRNSATSSFDVIVQATSTDPTTVELPATGAGPLPLIWLGLLLALLGVPLLRPGRRQARVRSGPR